MKWLALVALMPLAQAAVALPAHADMYQDSSNAKLPEARANLGAWPTVDAQRDLGCKGDGVTDNAACIAAAAATTGSPNIYFGPGTYLFNCGTYTFASAATIIGAGRDATLLKVKPGCTLPFLTNGAGNGLFNMTNGSGGGWRNLSIDLAGVLDNDAGITVFSVVFRYSCQNDFVIDNMSMTNIPDSSVGLLAQADGCDSHNWTVQNSRFHLTVQEPLHGNSGGILMGGGTAQFNNVHIHNNKIQNGGIQTSGENIFVTNNDISGWASGTALYQVQVISRRHFFSGNILHDSATTYDINATPAGGIELDGEYSVFSNNQCKNIGGACVVLYGSYNLVEGNTSQNAGTAVPQTNQTWGAYQVVDNAGPAYPNTLIPPTDNVIQNNTDLGGPNQLYSYFERFTATPHVNTIVRNNYFKGGSLGTYYVLNASTKITPSPNETIISNVTSDYVARMANTVYKPGGASLSTVNEYLSSPTLGTSAVPVGAVRGFLSQPSLAAGFTGTLGQVYGYDFAPVNTSAVRPGSIIGYAAGGSGTGNGATSGSYSNFGFLAGPVTAAAGAGGQVVNTGFRAGLGTGSSAGTINQGLWINGNGGAASTNYAIYSDSTARSLFSGPMTFTALPTSAGGGGLAVCVDSAGALYKKAACP
jgi:hypothetical protein